MLKEPFWKSLSMRAEPTLPRGCDAVVRYEDWGVGELCD